MPKIKKIENIHKGKKYEHDQYMYYCPGCEQEHAFALKAAGGNHQFNMDLDYPTVTPSLLNDFSPGKRCHSYINNGMIKFLYDCDHKLKGQNVELPEIENK